MWSLRVELQGPAEAGGSLMDPLLCPCPPTPSIRCLPADRLPPGFPEGPGPVCAHLCGPGLPGPQPGEEAAGATAAEVCHASGEFLPAPLV